MEEKPVLRVGSVDCPCCDNLLYTVIEKDGLYVGSTTNPPIDQDGHGAYLKCPHCSMRVALVQTSSHNFELANEQPCDVELP